MEGASGEALLVRADPLNEASEKQLEELYVAARRSTASFSLSATSLKQRSNPGSASASSRRRSSMRRNRTFDRLTRWQRELSQKPFFPIPSAADAERRLKECEESLAEFAEFVFKADQR